MSAFNRIVYGVDFSETSTEALKYALTLSSPVTEIHVLHAISMEVPV